MQIFPSCEPQPAWNRAEPSPLIPFRPHSVASLRRTRLQRRDAWHHVDTVTSTRASSRGKAEAEACPSAGGLHLQRRSATPGRQPRDSASQSCLQLLAYVGSGHWAFGLRKGLSTALLAACLVLESATGAAQARPRLTQDEQLTVNLFKDNTPSVVFITNLAVRHVPRCASVHHVNVVGCRASATVIIIVQLSSVAGHVLARVCL